MSPSQTPIETQERAETIGVEPKDSEKQPQPWTAPDFTERGVCAEIGAYSFVDR